MNLMNDEPIVMMSPNPDRLPEVCVPHGWRDEQIVEWYQKWTKDTTPRSVEPIEPCTWEYTKRHHYRLPVITEEA
jgi:hypothetical protein